MGDRFIVLFAVVWVSVAASGRPAIDVSGHWSGIALQGRGGTHSRFHFELWLEQDGDEVTGRAKVALIGQPQYYGVMSLQGRIANGRLVFQEGGLLENHPEPGTWWCIKRGELEISGGETAASLEGDWTAGTCAPGSIHVTREEVICDDDRIVSEYDSSDDDYHHYGGSDDEIATAICSVGRSCNRRRVFALMLTQARFIAPTSDRSPVIPCKTTRVRIGLSTDNFIRTTIDEGSFSVTNYTLEKRHLLHPGRITRTVIERDGHVFVLTEGEGLGRLPSLNELLAPHVWTGVDEELKEELERTTSAR